MPVTDAPAFPGAAELLGLILGSSFAAGLNLYATVLIAGLVQLAGWTTLPGTLGVLSHPAVLAIAGILFLVEFLADKVPFVDNAWDAVHTLIRPAAAALLAIGALSGLPDGWKVGAALLAGTVALTSHGAKASTRAAANVSPEPFSNWLLSTGEDVLAGGLTWLATTHPYWAAGIVVVLLVVAVVLVRTIVRLARKWLVEPLVDGEEPPARAP
ncbi:MAG: DUF4126 domain-containing protein [Gemmatimonadetes bacterium]|nr:DUF4126 domain-containing protein [Gemmatimonadota bacterium]